MKRFLLSLSLAFLSLTLVSVNVEAKRLGGGGFSGMKRQAPPAQPAQSVPAKPAATPGATGAAAAPAAAAAPKRSWMGPIAGLAAGLGLAALMSHLGMGAGFANFLTILLMIAVAFFAVRFLMRRFGPQANRNAMTAPQGMQFAGAGAGAAPQGFGSGPSFTGSNAQPQLEVNSAVNSLPPDFDAAGFERIAKLIFIRMQAANDAKNLDDLRQFSTPEMFATFRLELQERTGLPQQTDVVQLDAQVLEFVEEANRQIVSVRFHGLVREEKDAVAAPFDDVWYLVKPTDGSREWAIAGIAQNNAS